MSWASNRRRRRSQKPLPPQATLGDQIAHTIIGVGAEVLEAGLSSAADALLGRVEQAAGQVRQRVNDTRKKIRGEEIKAEVIDSDDDRRSSTH